MSTTPMPPGRPAAKPIPFRAKIRKQTAIVSRWLHIYLSMVSFAIILFFSITGITLNHAEALGGKEKTTRYSGVMNKAWLRPANNAEPDKLQIAEMLRAKHKLHGAVSDFRVDDTQISVSFKGPGYAADTFIDRDTGKYDLDETRNGFVAVINDLHKGRDTGSAWAWMIDGSAVLLVLVSLTGLVLLFFIYKKRTSGIIVLVAGALVCYLVYLRFVP